MKTIFTICIPPDCSRTGLSARGRPPLLIYIFQTLNALSLATVLLGGRLETAKKEPPTKKLLTVLTAHGMLMTILCPLTFFILAFYDATYFGIVVALALLPLLRLLHLAALFVLARR